MFMMCDDVFIILFPASTYRNVPFVACGLIGMALDDALINLHCKVGVVDCCLQMKKHSMDDVLKSEFCVDPGEKRVTFIGT